MQEILIRAGSFVAIIVLGYILRQTGFFTEAAFPVLSKIVLKITLPAAIVMSFSGKELDSSLVTLALVGLGASALPAALGFLLNRGNRGRQAMEMVNLGGYNIGNFTLPFVQSFLGSAGVIATSLFDVGNAAVCLGGAYSLAVLVKEGNGFSLKRLLLALLKSIPFLCYVIMTVLGLLDLRLPGPVLSWVGILSNANTFLAMLMIGVSLRLQADRTQIGRIARLLAVRYLVAVVLALVFWFLLPYDLNVRRTLILLVFSPVPASVPAFTGELKEDVGLASAVNSFSIIISIIIIVSLLIITA